MGPQAEPGIPHPNRPVRSVMKRFAPPADVTEVGSTRPVASLEKAHDLRPLVSPAPRRWRWGQAKREQKQGKHQ